MKFFPGKKSDIISYMKMKTTRRAAVIAELTGIITLPSGFDEKEAISSYLLDKYNSHK